MGNMEHSSLETKWFYMRLRRVKKASKDQIWDKLHQKGTKWAYVGTNLNANGYKGDLSGLKAMVSQWFDWGHYTFQTTSANINSNVKSKCQLPSK